MKKPNLLVIIVLLVLIAAVIALAAFLPQSRPLTANAPSLAATEAPPTAAPTTEPKPDETSSADAQPSEAPKADAYLVVSVRGMLYEPLPLAGEGSFTLKQDESTSNTIHVTPDSIRMEHSTCDNQDCVDQGTVSLENMKSRVLSNMIICLPNEVVLELHTPETLEANFGFKP